MFGPWRKLDLDFQAQPSRRFDNDHDGLIFVGIALVLVLIVVSLFVPVMLQDATGAQECVQMQYGRNAVKHWECRCPDGRTLRFNTIPTNACQ